MSAEAVAIVARAQEILDSENVVAALRDESQRSAFETSMGEVVTPDFEVTMVASESAGGRRTTTKGIEGFREAWEDWTGSYDHFRVEIEEVLDAGDKVLSLVRQVGVTKTGGVEIESKAAAVWTVRGGRIHAVEFHLDQEAARKAAGLDSATG